ncbi:MAG: amidohydrolase [Candidatus Thorarchaeota archaeon]
MEYTIDLLIINGNIATMDNSLPHADAIAVDKGRILAVGKTSELQVLYSSARKIINLQGRFLCPGFYDTHTHLIAISAKFEDVLLDKVKSPSEAIAKIKERVNSTPVGKWIFGEGWDESDWEEKRYLKLEELDAIAPKNPCFIRRICGHLAAVNTLALKELEIDFNDPDLPKDNTGKPSGIITDTLIDRLSDSSKLKKSQEDLNNAVKTACHYAHTLGVTSVTDNLSIYGLRAYQEAWKKGELKLRIYANIPRNTFENFLATGIKTGFGNEFLKIGGVKIFTDGSLGARTAALKEPYFDDPTAKGGFYIEKDVFYSTIEKAIENNWQTATHAIGDEAIDWVLEAFERIPDKEKVVKGRHRIEHAEFLLENQLQRAIKLGIILSMQPNFPGRWGQPGQLYEIRLGSERYKLLNNFRRILDEKTKVCFGSDNMPMSPIFGMYSVIAHPIENIRINAYEALYHFTLGAAFSSFEENIKGSIEKGKVADFVVLSKDLLKTSPEEINKIEVLMTIFNGEVVFEKAS